MNKFLFDRNQKGTPLELLIADYWHSIGIPFGFNPYSGTDDPRREDYDLYLGQPEAATLFEAKMDWGSGITGNIFVEEKALANTKASKIVYGRLLIDVFDRTRLVEMYNARCQGMHVYKHVITGGDQAHNPGMLLNWKDCKANSQPLWAVTKQLRQRHEVHH